MFSTWDICRKYVNALFKCIATLLHRLLKTKSSSNDADKMGVQKISGYKFTSRSLPPNLISCVIMHSLKHQSPNKRGVDIYPVH